MAKHAKHAAPPRRRRSAQKHTSHKGVTLYTLGVLLVAVSALLSLRLWPRRIVDAVPPATEAESPAVSEELVVPEPQPVVTTLRFSATGDNLIHAPIYSQAARRAAEGEGYSFDYCYANLLDFYAQQDINWINQETVSYTHLDVYKRQTFCCRSPGRKPSFSPASTAGRVSTMRETSLALNALTAIATAR